MKGQISQEFFLALSVYLLVFVVAITIAMLQLSSYGHASASLEAAGLARTIGMAINNIHLAGENASYNISFVRSGADINISGRYVTVTKGSSVRDFELLTDRVNASYINSSEIVLRNRGGVVQIEE